MTSIRFREVVSVNIAGLYFAMFSRCSRPDQQVKTEMSHANSSRKIESVIGLRCRSRNLNPRVKE